MQIRYFRFGSCVTLAFLSAIASADIEWTNYRGTFLPSMVGSICSEPHPATYIAVRSHDDWVSYWGSLRPHIGQTAIIAPALVPQPEVDFSKNIVLVASPGCKPSGGYTVQIGSIQQDESRLTVNVVEQEPGKGCAVTSIVTHPMMQVLIPQTGLKIDFNIVKKIHNCE
jgi:protease stability complex PrcB-like protein